MGEAPARLFPGSESHHSPQSLPFLITIPSKPGKCQLEPLTKDSSFPPAMATADSRAPVVEKVQQLPQAPCKRIRGKPGRRTDIDSDSTRVFGYSSHLPHSQASRQASVLPTVTQRRAHWVPVPARLNLPPPSSLHLYPVAGTVQGSGPVPGPRVHSQDSSGP